MFCSVGERNLLVYIQVWVKLVLLRDAPRASSWGEG